MSTTTATQDYDGDCDVDLFVTHLTTETNTLYVNNGGWFGDATNTAGSGPARLFRNDSGSASWLGLALRDATGLVAVGAAVGREPDSCGARRIATDGSYASASDPRVVFGLGRKSDPQFIRVRWADGSTERFGPLAPNRYHLLRQKPP